MNEDKIAEAINKLRGEISSQGNFIYFALLMLVLITGCPPSKASPLLSDGDEITSVGTVQVITPHPSWAAPIGGSQWISIGLTGWPLATYLSNGTVISFSEVFSLTSMPSSAMVTWAADDSAALYTNGSLVVAEAPMAGNAYTTCSDFGVTCTSHTVADILPWLAVGANEIRFDVSQRGGYSFGLNYAVSLQWLGDPPVNVPEPSTWIATVVGFIIGNFAYSAWRRRDSVKNRNVLLDAVRDLEPTASTLEIIQRVEGKVSSGAVYVELSNMAEEGILDRRTEPGGEERGGRERAFYAIKRKL